MKLSGIAEQMMRTSWPHPNVQAHVVHGTTNHMRQMLKRAPCCKFTVQGYICYQHFRVAKNKNKTKQRPAQHTPNKHTPAQTHTVRAMLWLLARPPCCLNCAPASPGRRVRLLGPIPVLTPGSSSLWLKSQEEFCKSSLPTAGQFVL